MKTSNAIYVGLLFIVGLFSITACSTNNPQPVSVCDESFGTNALTSVFSAANGYDNLPDYMDLKTHQYRVKINANGEICSVGYQNPVAWSGNYVIEIINETSNASYSGTHSFSQTQVDFQSITPVAVNSGDVVKVMRTIVNNANLNQTVGRILRKADYSNVPYPITHGNMEFLSSDFYGSGGPVPNIGQPYIPLGFKSN